MEIKADKIIKEYSEYYYETVMIISQMKTSLLKKKSFYLKSTYSSEIKRAVLLVILFLIQSFVIFSSTISWYLFIYYSLSNSHTFDVIFIIPCGRNKNSNYKI